MGKIRAALYLRLSKEDEDKSDGYGESASIQNQRLLLTDYVKRSGYETVETYIDDDESGLYCERPGFRKMIEDASDGKFDVVIAKSQSRFSRNMEHIERILHHDFPMMGVRFIGVCDHADTEDEGNKKTRQINGLVNEWYCEDLSKNIRSVFRAKMKAGEFLGASCPYGYRKDPENHNHLIVDDYAASVVRKIFRLYLDGVGKAKIGRMLSAEGILLPTLYKQQILGVSYRNARLLDTTGVWSYQTIHTILNNEVYIGNLIQNKYNKVSYKDKRVCAVPKEKWITVKNTHDSGFPLLIHPIPSRGWEDGGYGTVDTAFYRRLIRAAGKRKVRKFFCPACNPVGRFLNPVKCSVSMNTDKSSVHKMLEEVAFMTDAQTEKIIHLRTEGCGYTAIAKRMGISRDTVRSFCRRNGLAGKRSDRRTADADRCRECGKILQQTEGRKRRIFCSSSCRVKWWHEHPDQIQKKAVYSFDCACCGCSFTSYGNDRRKYCSHACYIHARFKGGDRIEP